MSTDLKLIASVEYAYKFTQSIQRLLQRLQHNHTDTKPVITKRKCGCALCHCDPAVEWRTYPNANNTTTK